MPLFTTAILAASLLVPTGGNLAIRVRQGVSEGTTADKLDLVAPLVQLSRHAYNPRGSTKALPKGYKEEPKPGFQTSITGFQARTYSTNEAQTVVVSFAGTDFTTSEALLGLISGGILGDLATDLELGTNGIPLQFTQAQTYFVAVKRQFPNSEIILTGHSLGGSLATFVGLLNKQSVLVFNSPGINSTMDELIPNSNKMSFGRGPCYLVFRSSGPNKDRFGLTQDVVTQLVSKAYGTFIEVVQLETNCSADKLCHSILNFEKKAHSKK